MIICHYKRALRDGGGVYYIHIYIYILCWGLEQDFGDWSRIIAELSPGITGGIYGRRHIDAGLRDEA